MGTFASSDDGIRVELGDGIATVLLDRPARLNALDRDRFAALQEVAARLGSDDDTHAVVISGVGRAFCAGLDLDEADVFMGAPQDPAEQLRGQEAVAEAILAWSRIPKPVVAAVNGAATGGGLALALASDVRIAAPAACFNVAMIHIGLGGADVGISWFLPRIVGLGRASELMLSGRLIDADEAFRIGLVNRVAPADTLLDEARSLARGLIKASPLAARLTKESLRAAMSGLDLAAAMDLENRGQALISMTDAARATYARFRSDLSRTPHR